MHVPLIRQRRHNESQKGFLATTRTIRFSEDLGQSSPAYKAPNTGSLRLLLQTRSERRIGSLKTYLGPLGMSAKDEFYESYRKLPKINERNQFEHETENPNVAYLNEAAKYRLIPVPHGILKSKGSVSDINLRQRRIGDIYAHAFSEGLAHIKSVESIDLNSNRLTETGSVQILSKLNVQTIREINLSENRLGTRTFDLLVEMLDQSKCRIKALNLEATNIKTASIVKLCESLVYNNSLIKLNLARNKVNEHAAISIGKMLSSNFGIRNLDLHWNQVRGVGLLHIFNGINTNTTLRELDLSWNALGRHQDDSGVRAMGEALRVHRKLMHLDISHNTFSRAECEIISKGLEENHTLLGIHAFGNDCEVDSRGFLIPKDDDPHLEAGHFFRRILYSRGVGKSHSKTNCWICEKWVEVTFEWTPGVSGKAAVDPVFIHLECDDYQPEYMPKQGSSFRLTRAVPPGSLQFFFSHPTVPQLSKTYPKRRLRRALELSVTFWPGCDKQLMVDEFNVITVNGQVCSIKDPFATQPRFAPYPYVPPEVLRPKTPWGIPISLFKDYKFDTDDLYNKCFEFDWKCSKIPKLVKDPEELAKVKEVLRGCYRHIKECYKYFSAIGNSGGVFSVGMNSYTDFVSQCGIIDNNFLLADLDFQLKSTLYNEVKNNPLNPANALVRYEFMEILVRIALDKFYRKKLVNTQLEAVTRLLEVEAMPVLSKFDSNIWKWQRVYLCEEVDLVLKANKNIMDEVYRRFTGRFDKPGKPKTMSLEEFQDVCNQSGLVNETFASREIDVCFNLAMMTQIDELSSRRHLQMSYVEFLEAISRACDLANLPPMTPTGDFEALSQEALKAQSLPKRLENAMPVLMRICPTLQNEKDRKLRRVGTISMSMSTVNT